MYVDANNLYGWAMIKFLSTDGFTWITPRDASFGYTYSWRRGICVGGRFGISLITSRLP